MMPKVLFENLWKQHGWCNLKQGGGHFQFKKNYVSLEVHRLKSSNFNRKVLMQPSWTPIKLKQYVHWLNDAKILIEYFIYRSSISGWTLLSTRFICIWWGMWTLSLVTMLRWAKWWENLGWQDWVRTEILCRWSAYRMSWQDLVLSKKEELILKDMTM